MRNLLVPTIALMAACSGEKDDPIDTGTVTEPEMPHVMRDCPEVQGNICPYAGDGYAGYNGDDVHRLDAWFSFPMSIAFSPYGEPVMSDWNNHKLRIINPNPEDGYRTIMGTDFLGDGDPDLLDSTPAGAPGTTVNLNHPTQHVYFSDGTLLSASWHTHKLRTWDPATGLVHVILGSTPGFSGIDFDEPAEDTLLNQMKEVQLDPTNEDLIYILDMRNERIRRFDVVNQVVDTVAGDTADADGDGALGTKGYCGEGNALETCFAFPKNANPEPGGSMALTADGTKMYIADSENHIIRLLDLVNGTIELFAGSPQNPGFADGPGASALFHYPSDLAIDHGTNQLFVADSNNHRVRVIDLDTGEVSTFAGTGNPSCDIVDLLVPAFCDGQHDGGDGGPATEATLYRPFGVDLDLEGNLVISDTYNHRIRIVYR